MQSFQTFQQLGQKIWLIKWMWGNVSIVRTREGMLFLGENVWLSTASSGAGGIHTEKEALGFFTALFCSQNLGSYKHSVSIWAAFSSLTRSLWGRQMGWFVENKPHLSLFRQCTKLVCQILFGGAQTRGEHLLAIINGNSQRAGTCSTVSQRAQTQDC